jgi:hypothetical protein
MRQDDRDLLEDLKFELRFLQKGGYGHLPRAPWRAPFIFQDSPICINYGAREGLAACSDCLLMQFVPAERQSERIPCQHIPLDATGRTLNTLYAYGTGAQLEIEEVLETWLKTTIRRLEQERSNAHCASMQTHREDGEAFLFEQWH